MEKQLIPQLRFSEFSDDWLRENLVNLGVKVIDGDRGKNYPNGKDFLEKGFCLFLNAKNVTKKGFVFNQTAFLNNEKDALLRKGKLKRGDLVLTTRGSVGHIAYYDANVPYDHIRINSGMVLLRNQKKSIIDNKYFYKYLNSLQLQRYILKVAFGSAQPQLTVKEIYNFSLSFPTLPEQQKIASFLTDVDAKITKLTKKKNLLEQYKKGIMQKIFNQELRFKDDDGNEFPDWEEKKLGVILDYEQPTKYIVESTEYNDDYKTPVLTAGKSFLLGYSNETEGVYNKLPTIIFDDFTMANKYVGFEFKVKSSAMKILQPKTEEVNIKFVYEAIQMINYPKGHEHKRFWISEYSKIKIGFPCKKEQAKIANFLTDIDLKLEALNTKIESNQTFKKGLLQQMFV